jgi:D-lactate dehydrogenase (cytochrome)
MTSTERSEQRSPLAEARHAHSELTERFGERFTSSPSICLQHSGLEGHHETFVPEAVVFGQSSEEISYLAAWCNRNRVPLIPHGAGTSLEGHLSAVAGGIALDVSAMTRIIDVSAGNLLCTVEAGVTREALNRHLRDLGLFFPIDPGANATIGGMAATRASGTNAVRYGTMRHNVLSLKVVLADGRIIDTGTNAPKSSAGYDLTALFVGSEGTLGIITEVTLRLYGIPEMILAGSSAFESLDGTVEAVIEAIQLGLQVARIELLDAHQIAACNAYSKMNLPTLPTLFLEFHGSEAGVDEQARLFAEIADRHGGNPLRIAKHTEERSQQWAARHNAYFAARALRPGSRVWTTDVCVPIAALAESIATTRADIESSNVTATIVGHVGDGNYHVMFVLDPAQPDEQRVAEGINERMVAKALALGGTCTGEHGIGIGKKRALIQERGQPAVDLMRTIKQSLDPNDIMNPSKIFG